MPADMLLIWLSLVGAALLSAVFTGALLPNLRRANIRQHVREDGPESHLSKAGTPSMGGLAIHAAFLVIVILLAIARMGLDGRAVAVVLFAVAMAGVGFLDDYKKLRRKGAYGFGARLRLVLEFLFAALLLWYLEGHAPERVVAGLALPGMMIGTWIFRIFAAIVLVGTANAVNLTDGLDGLAGGLTALAAFGLAGGCWALGQPDLALVTLAMGGAAAGFLWFNGPPARVFMGDVGSIGMGALLGGVAIAARIEVLLAIVGMIFLAETLSVIAQVTSFKLTGRRVLRMAPLHHHLELSGWPETTIVVRAWVIGGALALTGFLLVWGLA